MKLKALVVAGLFFVALALPFVPVQAGDGYERYTEWYSDAAKTNLVGWRQDYCNGTSDFWGYQTAYKEIWIGAACY